MKKSELKIMIKEQLKSILEIKKETFIDEFSFDKILPKKSRYKFKMAFNNIVDTLEKNDIDDSDIKKYMHKLIDMAFKTDSHPVFKDY